MRLIANWYEHYRPPAADRCHVLRIDESGQALSYKPMRCPPTHGLQALAQTPSMDHNLQPMQPLRTYIVEDSPVIRENLIATLEELLPVQVVGTAEDEATAVHWLAAADRAVDLVIVDIFLKQGTGLGVLRAAAAQPLCRQVVVLSNFATPAMRGKCLELGAHHVFDKSNEIDALLQYCDRLSHDDVDHSAAV